LRLTSGETGARPPGAKKKNCKAWRMWERKEGGVTTGPASGEKRAT